MKLHEYKAKYMSRLALLETTSKREKELKDMLITKLNNLRSMNLPNLIHTLYQILEYEDVSKDFKELCKSMVEDISKLDFGSD